MNLAALSDAKGKSDLSKKSRHVHLETAYLNRRETLSCVWAFPEGS